MNVRRFIVALLVGAWAVSPCQASAAATGPRDKSYPTGSIRIIVGVTPGGAADLAARLVASEMTTLLQQSVIVENRPGATGAIASAYVAKSPHDGYTLLLASTATHSNGVYFSHNRSYDPFRDFTPVGGIAEFPLILGVNAALDVKTVSDLVALARKRNWQLSFGSAGRGSTPHLAGELFELEAHVKLLHVPYKGSGQAAIDLGGGQIDMMFDGVPSLLPFIQSGKVRPIAALSEKHNPVLPDIPTFTELGYPAMVVSLWFGLMAPADTPHSVIETLNAALNKALEAPEVRKKLQQVGAQILPGTAAQFGTYVRNDYDRWGRVIEKAGIDTRD